MARKLAAEHPNEINQRHAFAGRTADRARRQV